MKKIIRKQGEKELIAILERKRNKVRFMKFPTKDSKIEKRKCKILDYVIHKQSNAPYKYFVLDLIQLIWEQEKTRKKELRIGYYILGKKKSVLNKWVWGQYAPLIPPEDLKTLFRKASSKGFI